VLFLILRCLSEDLTALYRIGEVVQALHHEDVWGSGCLDPGVLELGTSSRRVVYFMPSVASPLVPTGSEAGWARVLVLMLWRRDNS
jgi:hypothetical protein